MPSVDQFSSMRFFQFPKSSLLSDYPPITWMNYPSEPLIISYSSVMATFLFMGSPSSPLCLDLRELLKIKSFFGVSIYRSFCSSVGWRLLIQTVCYQPLES
ncbi:hypothetical protein FGO68_gene9386 [Halteria grandinella]|uniref:Uncharacterized protein n=1 Tax=Halteria grandinella TaxID=5974 RepID=A0A8J8P5B8_HALGN|nr:hypothetical protein FGO68_gene9386 [Halteria grandinella]